MAAATIVSSVTEFLDAVEDPRNRLGLAEVPATPWYLGQPDLKGDLLPPFYKSGIKPEYEREVLRDYRLSSAEFAPIRSLADYEILVSAQLNALPTRIIEWSANPLFALFQAVESMNAAEPGRVWILNPWTLNDLTAGLSFVPVTDGDAFKKYVVKIDDPDASPLPEASQPMAFRPTRTTRNYNLQNIYWTIHGKSATGLNGLTFFLKRADEFLKMIHVAADSKKDIMKELHDIGVTRSNFFPGLTSLTRTLAYRYSKNYIPDQ